MIDAGGIRPYICRPVKESGMVHAFEFVQGSINIMKRNLGMNSDLRSIIEIIPNPIRRESNIPVVYSENGPGSGVAEKDDRAAGHEIKSYSIDYFVAVRRVPRVDFLKMDLEGAALPINFGIHKLLFMNWC